MRELLPICLVFVCGTAGASNFQARLVRADAACASAGGSAYLQSIYKHVEEFSNSTLTRCFESIPSANNSGFIVVADILPNGKAAAIAAQPNTNVASCFIQALVSETFAYPPSGKYQNSFPVALNMDAIQFSPALKCLRRQ